MSLQRIGLYVAAGALAGAFGGLIAFGVAHIDNPKIPHWRSKQMPPSVEIRSLYY